MHEHCVSINLPSASSDVKTVTGKLYQTANLLQVGIHHKVLLKVSIFDVASSLQVPSGDTDLLLFAGQTSSSSTIVLVSLGLVDTKLTVNTDNIVLGSMIMKEIKTALEKC